MRRDQLNRRTHQTSTAAKAERPTSPQIIQRGKAVRAGGGGGELVFCKTDAPNSNEIECYRGEYGTGEVITVRCLICNGSSLMYAERYLKDGDEIRVEKIGDEWICDGFNGAKFT